MKRAVNNFILAVLNAGFLFLAILLFEYDVSRLRRPDISWIPTNSYLDLILSGLVVLISVLNLAMLILTVKKGPENHRWLWGLTLTVMMILFAIVLILNNKFLPILFPNARP